MNSIDPDNLSQEDINTILEFEEQQLRCENFERIFPEKKTFKKYIKFFEEKRYKNYVLWNHIKSPLIDIESMLA